MNIKAVGSASMRAGNALESLGRTDDMLAVIGVIMLAGVLVSSYGAFWQGRLAAAQFKKQCSCEPGELASSEGVKTAKYTAIMTTVTILIIGLIIYIFRKQISDKFSR